MKPQLPRGPISPLLFAVCLLFALRGTRNRKAVPYLPQDQALGGRSSWVWVHGQRYKESRFTSSRAGRSRLAGWRWAAATASEGWRKRWHRRAGAQRRRPSGRGCPPSSGTSDRQLPSLQSRTETGEWRLSHDHLVQQSLALWRHWKTSVVLKLWRNNIGNPGLPGIKPTEALVFAEKGLFFYHPNSSAEEKTLHLLLHWPKTSSTVLCHGNLWVNKKFLKVHRWILL